jgi:hypothetical protein
MSLTDGEPFEQGAIKVPSSVKTLPDGNVQSQGEGMRQNGGLR